MIEVLTSGPANSIQDRGRFGLLPLGIGRSGAMDAVSAALANALLANPADAALIEVAMFPFRLRFTADTVIALTGADTGARLDGRRLPPFWRLPVRAGAELVLSPPDRGARAYVAVRGGLDVPRVLGSRATDMKGGYGGLGGRGLARGDRIAILPPEGPPAPTLPELGALPDPEVAAFWRDRSGVTEVRAVPAAEYPRFTPESRALFLSSDWQITPEANRMGYRLSGPVLSLDRKLELLSHGILPGTVQVPPAGQPIVQLADANTCGGYPKIVGVIEADLWRIAQTGPGEALRFVLVTPDEAIAAHRAQIAAIERVRAAV